MCKNVNFFGISSEYLHPSVQSPQKVAEKCVKRVNFEVVRTVIK